MGSRKVIESLGITINDPIEVRNDNEKVELKKPIIEVKGGIKELAVEKGIIPPAYKDVEFDVQHIKNNIIGQNRENRRKFKVNKFYSYIEVLNYILASIRAGVMPNCSYLIGAPNGFGKTSFVNTALKVMLERSWNCVPYISLSELAELRVENEKRLLKGMELGTKVDWNKEWDEPDYKYYKDNTRIFKVPEVITGRFSWSEYMNADMLFCFFSSMDSKVIESHTLKCILDIRGAKALPTVAFISTSLNPYKLDNNLREYIWDEILAYKPDKNCFDRVYHVSCYKIPNNIIGDNELGIEGV